jgi:hypothetical protein
MFEIGTISIFYIIVFLNFFVNPKMAYPKPKNVVLLNKIVFICIETDINFVYWELFNNTKGFHTPKKKF